MAPTSKCYRTLGRGGCLVFYLLIDLRNPREAWVIGEWGRREEAGSLLGQIKAVST